MKISALVLTKNEQEMIEDCLKQLDFVQEIIVLDQNSKDKTVSIAKKYTDKIFSLSPSDFSQSRNLLSQKAKGDWLLYVDADERISQKLKKEIIESIKSQTVSAYYFPRKNIILGKWLRHGGWWPDYVPRLFRKEKLISWRGKLHESPEIKGDFARLKEPLVHYTAERVSEMFAKSRRWAKIEAQLFVNEGNVKISSFKIAKSLVSEFFKRYFIKLGFLDGTVGLIEAIYQGLHRAMILVYIWELQGEK